MIPPLWFRVMDPKLMQWAGGDIAKVNVDPAKRTRLYAKYAAKGSGQSPTSAMTLAKTAEIAKGR
jgi:hypothetical protein